MKFNLLKRFSRAYQQINLKALGSSFLAICLVFFGAALVLNLITPLVYGAGTANAWNLLRDGSNNLNFQWSTGPNNAMSITSGGNVGIGVAVPGVLLDVNGGSTTGPYIRITGTGTNPGLDIVKTGGGSLRLNSEGFATGVPSMYTIGTNDMALGTNSTEVIRIKNGGNVGIGTTNPLSSLHVAGAGTLRIANTVANPGYAGWILSQDGAAHLDFSYPSAAQHVLYLKYDTGNVGVGVTTPQAKLNILGANTLATADLLFTFNAAGDYRNGFSNAFAGGSATLNKLGIRVSDGTTTGQNTVATFQGDGNVGIGTTAPTLPLEVVQTSTWPALNILKYSNGRATMGFGLNNGPSSNTGFIMGRDLNNNGTNDFYMVNLATSVFPLYISSASKVGIRKTSPTADLHIKQSSDTQYAGGIMLENVAGNLAPIFLGSDQKTYIYSGSSGGWARITTGGTWEFSSSKLKKENYTTLNNDDIMQKIDQLPVMGWNYKTEGPSVRRIGPFAEDFHSIFGLGDNDETIAISDESGVALAGVKALSEKVSAQQTEIDLLKKQLELLKSEVEQLKK